MQLYFYRQRTWRVVLGDHDINVHEGKEQYMSVSAVHIHPQWNRNNVAGGYEITKTNISCNMYRRYPHD